MFNFGKVYKYLEQLNNGFWSVTRVLSYGRPTIIVTGSRSVGKSTQIAALSLITYMQTGRKFMYIRRRPIDVNKTYKTFFNNAVQIIGDKNTNTNLRYKVGKALNCSAKNCFEITRPKQVGLPTPNVSSSYMFCSGSDFFAYPNNFNYYAQFYRNTFQHGGISLEEMVIPIIKMKPKK